MNPETDNYTQVRPPIHTWISSYEIEFVRSENWVHYASTRNIETAKELAEVLKGKGEATVRISEIHSGWRETITINTTP